VLHSSDIPAAHLGSYAGFPVKSCSVGRCQDSMKSPSEAQAESTALSRQEEGDTSHLLGLAHANAALQMAQT
jgi:hypothetical protein